MANEVLQKYGTATLWTSSGGDKAMDMASLASAAARVGASLDRGTPRSRKMQFELEVDFASSPTKGTTVDLYIMTSSVGTTGNWDGGTDPADAALGSVDTLPQFIYVGSIVVDDITTKQRATFEIENGARYIAPIVHNNATGQALTSTGTDQKLIMTPVIDELQ